ncbi:MAG TPA: prenyltransferase/squalene oxidase repeat-containing protein [Gemmataceae bacterium]|nr:prenyltransferase/squalene oxidase repeat-containing protein [Gemmataceae bacterium]
MTRRTQFLFSLLPAAMAAVVVLTPPARAVGPDPKDVQAVLDKGYAFLKKHQGEDGSFSPKVAGPGVTALVVAALIRNGYSDDDPVVAKGLAYLEKNIQPNGGVYSGMLANYTTSVALMAFQEANKNGKYDAVLKNGTKFLKGLQDDAADPKDAHFGGVGYDGRERPDLSNTQYFVDSLIQAGVPKDDPAIQRALQFVSRCQNLPGESQDQPFAAKATEDDKGGFVYRPDPDDKQHQTAAGGLRSLGAMTYGGLKTFLYAGVKKDDSRVQGAIKWIRAHYTLDENPGLKQAGLFYYFHTFGKAMAALGDDTFEDAKGVKHDWRQELFQALKSRQGEDGGWINQGDRMFGEGDDNLATGFALLALSYTKK